MRLPIQLHPGLWPPSLSLDLGPISTGLQPQGSLLLPFLSLPHTLLPPGLLLSLSLFLLPLLTPLVRAYEAPEDRQDIFARHACPAFLLFDNAAYLADMTLELPCRCKPEQVHSVVWYYQRELGSEEGTRVLTDLHGKALVDSQQVGLGGDLRGRFSIRLFSLLIFRAQPEDSGHYLCGTTAGDFFYGYDVDVQEAKEVVLQRREARKRRRHRRLQRGEASNLPLNQTALYQVFTHFWPWSVCDRCGLDGEQTRVGLCYVQTPYLQVRYRHNSPTVASCHSGGVPQRFGLNRASRGGAKLEVRSCRAPCPPRPSPSPQRLALLDFLGYSQSLTQGSVPVYHHNHPADTPLVLACPGAKPQHAVAWDLGSLPLYRFQNMEGLNQTSPRRFIDSGHHLHFHPAVLEDSGSYYCWLQGSRAAEIRLVVYLRLGGRRRLSDPETGEALWALLLCYAGLTGAFLLVLLGRAALRHFLRPTPHLY